MLALFFFGTIYFSVLAQGNSWFLSHILTITCLLLAINESFGARRDKLIALWLGAAFLTRVTAAFALPFFLHLMWRERRLDLKSVARLAIGFAPALVFFLWYNFARFGGVFETGYAHAVVGSPALAEALSYGLFSPVHIPKNLYALFLAMPQPVPGWDAPALQFPYILPSGWGLSIFFTTPIFLYAFRVKLRDTRVIAGWLAVVAILIPLLLYYGIGWRQFGYRYALDFYPFLFIPTALALSQNFTPFVRTLIVVCIVVNLWGALLSMIGLFV
jgi:heme/copper-type cytochrome/quinol oxidase subunit 4